MPFHIGGGHGRGGFREFVNDTGKGMLVGLGVDGYR